MKFAALLLFLTALFVSERAVACDTEKTATAASDCVVMARAGVRGVWFELQLAEELRVASRSLAELARQVNGSQQIIDIREYQLTTLASALAFEREAKRGALNQADLLARDAQRARGERDAALRSRDAWYRSPLLWGGAGLVLGLVGGVAVASAF